MPNVEEVTTRLRLKTIADNVTSLDATRNVLGAVDIDADTDFLATMITEGPYLVIKPASMTEFTLNPVRNQFEIECELLFGFPADEDYTYVAIENIVFALRNAWALSDNYTDVSMPVTMTLSAPETRFDLSPVIGSYKFLMGFVGC